MARVTQTTIVVFFDEVCTKGGLQEKGKVMNHEIKPPNKKKTIGIYSSSYLPNKGIFASSAPKKLQTQIQSQTGNDELVTWARIIFPTWCANCKPQAHRNGTKAADFKIYELSYWGCDSQAIWSRVEIRKGSKCSRGLRVLFFWARVARQTLR